jgi:hypothetical protein
MMITRIASQRSRSGALAPSKGIFQSGARFPTADMRLKAAAFSQMFVLVSSPLDSRELEILATLKGQVFQKRPTFKADDAPEVKMLIVAAATLYDAIGSRSGVDIKDKAAKLKSVMSHILTYSISSADCDNIGSAGGLLRLIVTRSSPN